MLKYLKHIYNHLNIVKIAGCPEGTFKCVKRQKCINNEKRCDGVNDCPDHSDEINCCNIHLIHLINIYLIPVKMLKQYKLFCYNSLILRKTLF